ncbi:Transcription factor TFIIIB component B [Acarospora aff. strigata]|nr:Transcription factor TFIIIB component B [Acarospora aff. strigata]
MSTFGSSVINKSGKKFAPKAPARRPAAPSSTQSSTRASVERQALSQTPQPPARRPSLAEPPAPTTSAAPDTLPASIFKATSDVPTSKESSTPIPTPTRKSQEPSSSAHVQLQPQEDLQPSHRQPSAHGPETASQKSVENVNELEHTTENNGVRAEEALAVNNNGPLGGVADAGQGAPAGIEAAIALSLPTRNPTHEEDIHTEPVAKRRRIEASPQQLPASIEAIATDSSAPISTTTDRSVTIPTTETNDPATQATEAQVSQDQPTGSTKKKKKRTAKTKGKQRLEDAAASIVADATRPSKRRKSSERPGRRRQTTPEDAEIVRITPSLVKMADLCKDLRTGKKSKRETELQGMDAKEIARKEEERRILREGGEITRPDSEAVPDMLDGDQAIAPQHGHLVPQTRLRNGVIEVDPDSLVLDRHAHAAQNAVEVEIHEENTLTRRVTSATWLKREKTESWNEEFTDRFYQGLRMFGTDFEMISKMFPGRTRRTIKLKFCKEEKLDREKIKETLLGPREPVDIVKFSEMTNIEYKDPQEFQRELDEDRRNLEEQQAKEREAHDDLMRQKDAEIAAEGAAVGGGGSSGKENEAQGVGIGTPAPAKGKRGRKSTGKTKPGRAKKVVGGAVEVLGTVD